MIKIQIKHIIQIENSVTKYKGLKSFYFYLLLNTNAKKCIVDRTVDLTELSLPASSVRN